MNKLPHLALSLAAILALSACQRQSAPDASGAAASGASAPASQSADAHASGIAWVKVQSEQDVSKAFEDAKARNVPVFLYWGAVWCPPCNQVKATIFSRQDFVERTKGFVAVYLDGDAPGAQKLGERFKVRGYPTMILFKPDGQELSRLPGEVDGQKYIETLDAALQSGRPIQALLKAAQKGEALSDAEWRGLAFYSWEGDENQLVPKAELPKVLADLAAKVPSQPALQGSAARLRLKALYAAAQGAAGQGGTTEAQAAARKADLEFVLGLLGDQQLARENLDVVTNLAKDLTGYLTAPKSEGREQLAALWGSALDRLSVDRQISRNDQLSALVSRVDLVKLDDPKAEASEILRKTVSEQVARIDRETTQAYERQALMTTAAHVLGEVGLREDADKLLQAELPKAVAADYYMNALASSAKKRGDGAAAVAWNAKAYDTAKGPATKLQWGATWIGNLTDLTPKDTAAIDKAVSTYLDGLKGQPEVFYERNTRSLAKTGAALARWAKAEKQDALLKQFRSRLQGVCDTLPAGDAQRKTCEGVWAGKA